MCKASLNSPSSLSVQCRGSYMSTVVSLFVYTIRHTYACFVQQHGAYLLLSFLDLSWTCIYCCGLPLPGLFPCREGNSVLNTPCNGRRWWHGIDAIYSLDLRGKDECDPVFASCCRPWHSRTGNCHRVFSKVGQLSFS